MIDLSFEEKISLVTGKGSWHTNDCNDHMPSVHISDGPHGLRIPLSDSVNQNNTSKESTCYPTASASACSWDRDLIKKMAFAIGSEAHKAGVSIVLGPGINMKRSPLCGRNFEYFSEDPYLAGSLGTSYVNSMQQLNIGTSLKHFAGNSQETLRQTANSEIDERALREIYLAAFEMVVKEAHPYTIMASYNRLNGFYACENKRLLTEILRNEWGYDGTVISDWGACVNLAKCIDAGMDLEMPDSQGIHSKQLADALKQKKISMESLDRAVSNIQTLVQKCTDKKPINKDTVSPDYHQIAREVATESAVLLKNDGMLPLHPCPIVIIGDLANHMRFQGGGSSHINTKPTVNAVEALQKSGFEVTYERGYDVETDLDDSSLEKEAIAAANLGLPILFFGGLTERYEGEGYDRTTLAIPSNQRHLLEKLSAVNDKIIMITFGGSPMDLSFVSNLHSNIHSILHMYLGGEAVGEACADLIAGVMNPCGKLAETFPARLSDIPSFSYFGANSNDVEYRESIFIGYRYYDTYQIPIQYCFGHGLSYTTYKYWDMNVNVTSEAGDFPVMNGSEIVYTGNETLTVSCRITNTGTVAGKEIIQLYIENPACHYLRAKKELRQFTKIALEPGDTKEIHLTLNKRSFSIYDEASKRFLMPSGTYVIHLASSINDIRLSMPLTVSGEDYDRDDTSRLKEYFTQSGPSFLISKEQFQVIYSKPLSNFDHCRKGDFTTCHSLKNLSGHSLLGKISLFVARKIAYHMLKDKPHDDPEVLMMVRGIEDGTIDSIVCQSDGMIPYKLAEAIVLSANGHHLQAIGKLIRK